MHYFLLPLIPLTITGALFFKKDFMAYGLAIALTAIKMWTTWISPVYFFIAISLILLVCLIRRLHKTSKVSLVRAIVYTMIGVALFELITNFGVWLIGGRCLSMESRLYTFTFSGLTQTYQAALPYALRHLAKAIPMTLFFVWGMERLKYQSFISSSHSFSIHSKTV